MNVVRHRLGSYAILVLVLWIAFGLRVYHLQTIPNGLFIDEAARGYDAYSLAHTGADMFGVFMPLFPRGFDDYTPALYTYLTVPFVWLLDLSRFSTRYAAVWIGMLIVAVGYQTMRHLLGQAPALVGAGLLAISPWYILLSRIGTEWILLGLGPMLTVLLAYRGLTRARWLMAAGVVGGLSLYGYAPVKAFLPVLLLMFGLSYRRPLWQNRRVVLRAGLLWLMFATPVYLFSFTAAGQIRYQEVSYLQNHTVWQIIPRFVENYLAYFDPRFLFISDPAFLELFYIQRFKHIGLLYWFELPLILTGLGLCWRMRRQSTNFWVTWLLIAPLGINLHIHSPKPALWLTATPVLHGLAGLGAVYLGGLIAQAYQSSRRWAALGVMVLSTLLVLWNIGSIGQELLVEFPRYSATEVDWWATGVEAGITDLAAQRAAFDTATLQPFSNADMNRLTGIYYAFYTNYPPTERQRDLKSSQPSQIDGVQVGNLQQTINQPGCHLALLSVHRTRNLALPIQTLTRYHLPDGQPNFELVAIANPPPQFEPIEAVFGDQILLRRLTVMTHQPMAAGQAICLLLDWQSVGNLPMNYTVFVHLLGPPHPADGTPLWAQHDGPPANGLRPTTTWQAGEAIPDLHVITVPETAVGGPYQLQVGLYHPDTGTRLPLASGEDALTVMTFDLTR